MKKKRLIQILLPAAYCVPYAFMAVYGDAYSGSLLFYALMAVALAALFRAALSTGNRVILFTGNVLSFLSSLAAAKLSGMELMGEYFKPFTMYSLIILLSMAAFLLQTVVLIICAKRKKTSR